MSTETKNKPVEKVRVRSAEVAIWKNVREDGTHHYSASPPQFSYRDRTSGEYKPAKALNGYNLVDGATALLQANQAMAKLRAADKKAGAALADEPADEDIPF